MFFYNFLTFEQHIKMLTNNLSKAVGILNKVKIYLNKPALLSLYSTFFYSQLYYGLLRERERENIQNNLSSTKIGSCKLKYT